jgi:hypothetical protein
LQLLRRLASLPRCCERARSDHHRALQRAHTGAVLSAWIAPGLHHRAMVLFTMLCSMDPGAASKLVLLNMGPAVRSASG